MSPSYPPPPQLARAFLESKRLTVEAPYGAYTLLASYAEGETVDRRGTQVLTKLKRALHADPASPYEKEAWKLQIVRFVCELQHRR